MTIDDKAGITDENALMASVFGELAREIVSSVRPVPKDPSTIEIETIHIRPYEKVLRYGVPLHCESCHKYLKQGPILRITWEQDQREPTTFPAIYHPDCGELALVSPHDKRAVTIEGCTLQYGQHHK